MFDTEMPLSGEKNVAFRWSKISARGSAVMRTAPNADLIISPRPLVGHVATKIVCLSARLLPSLVPRAACVANMTALVMSRLQCFPFDESGLVCAHTIVEIVRRSAEGRVYSLAHRLSIVNDVGFSQMDSAFRRPR